MPRLKNVEKLASALNLKAEKFSDNSATWVSIEDKDYSICISFDGKGEVCTGIRVDKKIYQHVDNVLICKMKP